MKKITLIITFFIITACTGQESMRAKVIDNKIIEKEVIGKNVQLIDIRTPKEYEEGYIDNAINIDYYDKVNFLKQFDKLNKTKPIYIYCHSGIRSHNAIDKLLTLGFTKIYDYKGGYKEWSRLHEDK